MTYKALEKTRRHIGYPFEPASEQVMSYFDADNDLRGKPPYIALRTIQSMCVFISLPTDD